MSLIDSILAPFGGARQKRDDLLGRKRLLEAERTELAAMLLSARDLRVFFEGWVDQMAQGYPETLRGSLVHILGSRDPAGEILDPTNCIGLPVLVAGANIAAGPAAIAAMQASLCALLGPMLKAALRDAVDRMPGLGKLTLAERQARLAEIDAELAGIERELAEIRRAAREVIGQGV